MLMKFTKVPDVSGQRYENWFQEADEIVAVNHVRDAQSDAAMCCIQVRCPTGEVFKHLVLGDFRDIAEKVNRHRTHQPFPQAVYTSGGLTGDGNSA